MSTWDAAEGVDFRGPLDLTRAATAVLDAQGTVLGWSPRARDLFGHEQEEAVGTPVARLLAAPGLDADPGRDEGAEGPDATGEFEVRRRDGGTMRVAVRIHPLPLGGSAPRRILLAAELEELRLWETRQAVLHSLLAQSPTGLTVYDARPRVVWANDTCKRELADSPQQFVGLGPDELVPGGEILSDGHPPTLADVVRNVLETGEPVLDLHYRGRPPEAPERDRVWSYSYYRLLGTDGEPLGVCEESYDITASHRARERLQLLVRAGEHVGTTLDVPRTARELAEVAVPHVADSVVVDLLPEVLEGREPAGSPTSVRTMRRVASRTAADSVPVGDVEARAAAVWAREGETGAPSASKAAGDPGGPNGAGDAGGTGGTRSKEPGPVFPGTPLQLRSLASGRAAVDNGSGAAHGPADGLPLRTLAVPLRSRGPTLGLVTFVRSTTPDPFDADEAALAEELVKRAAVCVDNARRFTSEHTAALTLQRSLLPQHLPPQTAVDTAHRYLPADSRVGVGGDWFDIIPLSGTRVGLVVGDVVGHGLRAAATMGRLRTTVRALARLDLAPDELLTRLDDVVVQAEEERAQGGGEGTTGLDEEALGVTCLYAVYDPVSQRCVVSRAGHLLPAVVPPEGGVGFPELPAGLPLGTGGPAFESVEMDLPHGSLLALFTDGLVEARDLDIDEGLARLGDVLAHHDQPLEALCDRVLRVLPSGAATDDAALLLVRTRALGADQVAVWEVAADPAVVADVRTEVGERLQEWGLAEMQFTTELIVSELVTNAIRHAGGLISLRLIRDRTLICEVADVGHTSPHLRHAAGDDEGGRGLFLVAQTTHRWGTRYTSAGKVIWAEQPLPPTVSAPVSAPAAG